MNVPVPGTSQDMHDCTPLLLVVVPRVVDMWNGCSWMHQRMNIIYYHYSYSSFTHRHSTITPRQVTLVLLVAIMEPTDNRVAASSVLAGGPGGSKYETSDHY
jgi:hypothetical protein